ncbi:MAG: aromatic amino acid DMT transporter YddG [Planctomycetes bacterium]|nr:aromatic amino acid DMT transporter YddG [Planctomycetota bacterium]
MNPRKATLIGLISVLLWSANIGCIRLVTEALGPVGGLALMYTVSAVLLYLSFGFPKLSEFPRTYLIIASILFCVYELCFSLSLGLATTARQTMEVGMVNYLWPSITITMAILFNGQKANWLIVPGMVLAFVGVCLVVGGDEGLNFGLMWQNIQSNPASYGMAFAGALFWGVYCTLTSRMAQGKNGITFFFILTAVILWVKFAMADNPALPLSVGSFFMVVVAAAALAFGYATWNIGILYGNVTLLSAASYMIPVFSALIAATLLNQSLSFSFWQGCAMTSIGSLICWFSTRTLRARAGENTSTSGVLH